MRMPPKFTVGVGVQRIFAGCVGLTLDGVVNRLCDVSGIDCILFSEGGKYNEHKLEKTVIIGTGLFHVARYDAAWRDIGVRGRS